MKKADVLFHSDNGYRHKPAVNIKVYSLWSEAVRLAPQVAEDNGEDPDRFTAWIEEQVEKDYPSAFTLAQEWATESAFDCAQEDAVEIFGHGVKIWQEGRMGGWLVVDGLPHVEDWDAVQLAKWARFTRYVKAYVADYPYQVVTLLCINQYQSFVEEDDARRNIEYTRRDLRELVGVAE